ncbi:MAG: GNAT family N-acetyltransferase [Actinobacteria bacterium]|nr:GNAT family N-acetyltransferase [Actinomycetota bacterium]MBA3566330.1 GNAT family N-acetyltransferase [Actinomycetota bacterium]
MAYRVRPCRSLDELGQAASAIGHYFGWVPTGEEVERFSQVLPVERMHAAFDGKEIVGGAGVFPFEMTIPGGPVSCAGVTVVGVLPTHRRRGLLSRMMRAQIDDIHERGEPFAALWASEPTIYGRFGYGHASLTHEIRLPRIWAALRAGTPARSGQVRLVESDEAQKVLPRLYDRVRKETPGFLSRSKAWWELRRLRDDPSRRPPGSGPLNRAVFEIDGRPAGYALYRIAQSEEDGHWKRNLRVVEALGVDTRATLEIWRFLLEVDWTDDIQAFLLPTDHSLMHLVARVDRLDLRVGTGLWVRPVDVGATLSARRYRSDSRITFEIRDSFCTWNEGAWTLADGVAKRSSRRPDLRLDVQALGAAYLGGFSFAELSRAGLVEEASRGGLARADALFRSDRAPWCPEIF